ncbi:MAG: 50S ribosomal protein L11 [Alphaproteobacteria bacterium GM7ARS4]|nr:50S ribosomal protein L11 [Alphaproteobacteria bacterium GM7ARS4]
MAPSKKKTKEVVGTLRLQIPAGQANPSPPVGPALGQKGLNIMEFCKAFNDRTKMMEAGSPIPVVISIYKDKSFSFDMRSPPASYMIKKALSLGKGSATAGRGSSVASIDMETLRSIAETKKDDLNAYDVEEAVRIIAGTARSMGVQVKN